MSTPDIKHDTMRCTLPGFEPLAMHDPSGRRGLWARTIIEGGEVLVPKEGYCINPPVCEAVEIIAGREGDDAYVKLRVGETITQQKMNALLQLISYVAGAYEDGKEGDGIVD